MTDQYKVYTRARGSSETWVEYANGYNLPEAMACVKFLIQIYNVAAVQVVDTEKETPP